MGVTEICDTSEAAIAIDTQPGAAGLQVTSGQQLGLVRPKAGCGGRPAVVLVAIGSNQYRELRVLLPLLIKPGLVVATRG